MPVKHTADYSPSVNLNLSGQSAVIFGGANGIGRAIATAFAEEGCRIGIFDRTVETDKIARDISSDAPGIAGDVCDANDVMAATSRFRGVLGPTIHVIYTVGIGSGKFGFPFWNLTPSDWPRILEVNLIGAVNVAHAFAPHFVEHQQGTMLFLTSVAGQIGSQTDPPYSAAKAGLINFMQCAAKDLAPYGVRANCLSPGMVQTGLNKSVWAAAQQQQQKTDREDYENWGSKKVKQIAPLGNWQKPEEFGAMAVYLASEHARNITGQTINIDGGQVMHS